MHSGLLILWAHSEGSDRKRNVSFLFKSRFSNILGGWALISFCCNKSSNFNTCMHHHTHAQALHVYSPLTPNTHAYTAHHTHTTPPTCIYMYTHITQAFPHMQHTHHTTWTFPLTPGTHTPCHLFPYPTQTLSGQPNFQPSLPHCQYFSYTLLLATWTHQTYSYLWIGSFSLRNFSFPDMHAHGFTQPSSETPPWPRTQGSTEISGLSAPLHCSPDGPQLSVLLIPTTRCEWSLETIESSLTLPFSRQQNENLKRRNVSKVTQIIYSFFQQIFSHLLCACFYSGCKISEWVQKGWGNIYSVQGDGW